MKKKILLFAAIIGASLGTIAQDDNEEAKVFTPEAGDWALGIDAAPIFNYFGNFIGGNGFNVAPTWKFANSNQTITGKYYSSDEMAFRVSFRFGTSSESGTEMVTDRSIDWLTYVNPWPTAIEEVENTYKYKTSNIGLSGGIEMRKGKGRLIGFYGGELGIYKSGSKQSYTYGNALTATAAAVDVDITAADDFGSFVHTNYTTYTDGTGAARFARVLENKDAGSFTFGLRGFIGVEYFVIPKLSVGGEFGWALALTKTGATSTTYETEGFTATGVNDQIEEITVEGVKGSEFTLDTDNNNSVFGPAGSLRIMFHF